MTQATDGSRNINVVSGSTYVGRYGANGAVNVVQVPGTSLTGLNHPSGALNVFNATTVHSTTGTHHPCGAACVSTSGGGQAGNHGKDGSFNVTALSGSLT